MHLGTPGELPIKHIVLVSQCQNSQEVVKTRKMNLKESKNNVFFEKMKKPRKPTKNHISPKNNGKTVRKIDYVITVHK